MTPCSNLHIHLFGHGFRLWGIGDDRVYLSDCLFFHDDIKFMAYVDDGIFLGSNDWQLQEVIKEIQNLGLNIEYQGHPKVRGSWGRRLLAVAEEVTRHGRAHPYSWSITIVSQGSKESEESYRSEWKTKLLSMFLAVTCQHTSGACQSHSRPVLNLREALQKYIELSPSTPPFLTLRFHEIDLTPTPNLLQISGRYSLRLVIFDTPSARAYLFSPLKVIRVTGSVG